MARAERTEKLQISFCLLQNLLLDLQVQSQVFFQIDSDHLARLWVKRTIILSSILSLCLSRNTQLCLLLTPDSYSAMTWGFSLIFVPKSFWVKFFAWRAWPIAFPTEGATLGGGATSSSLANFAIRWWSVPKWFLFVPAVTEMSMNQKEKLAKNVC